ISLWIAVMLVVTLIPVMPAKAAGSYFEFNNYSLDVNSPTQVNSDTIDVSGTFAGVAFNTIEYKVELLIQEGANQYRVGAVNNGVGISPTPVGLQGFLFPNVEIFAGLNRITVAGVASSTGEPVALEAFVYFPNVPTV